MNNVLEIKDLKKTYHSINGSVEAIENFSLNVLDKEFVSIIGSSGCGKSTVLNIIASLDKASEGSINFIKTEKPRIGYMLQQDSLFPWLTILDNATLGLKIKNMLTKENIEYAKSLLIKYGLNDFLDKYPDDLSGGMRQRVALIRTLSIKPDILLLDEPFSALDYVTRLQVSDDVYNIIKEEEKAVIMVTHDIAEAISLSDRIVVLSKRPSVIKNVYDIELTDKKNPIHNRKCKEFRIYYDMLWRDLDA